MRRRIELLNEVQEAGGRKAGVSAELYRTRAMVRCVDMMGSLYIFPQSFAQFLVYFSLAEIGDSVEHGIAHIIRFV